MKKFTVTLDDATAAWVRRHAASQGKGVSRLLGDLLKRHMREQRDYLKAMRRFQAIKPMKFAWVDGRPPTREELHDRSRFRG